MKTNDIVDSITPIIPLASFVVIIFALAGLSSCSQSEERKWEQFVSWHFPPGATNIEEVGNDWYTFELDGNCFLYHDYYREGHMARIPCE